ncbi:hypothetical protein SAMN06265379_101555 [Saccharicrinis carchari]|uniref:Uncharacterized protein n=1 Tax=Saccharicrinis carchari TaxID=1168039 RepID=A0A521B054_SACCC|nr:DUF6448 family protein [Saccharicrinis carchari]SMO40478.1 hypothetical protein SAMN06265379_101555 [Saccharicrinis carchari]
MKTQERKAIVAGALKPGKSFKLNMRSLLLTFALMLVSLPGFAHCDSYDGPVIKDALKALDKNNVQLVLKWIEPQQEKEIISLFDKTYRLKKGDKQVYSIVEKHFLETLVRLHRETEGAPYTGLKPAGSTTPLVVMADNSIAKNDVGEVINTVTTHLEQVLRDRYATVAKLGKTKDESVEQGRAYVHAYVQYTHTLEALEHILHGDISH